MQTHIFINLASLCLLVGALNSFTFKVITDMYDPIGTSQVVPVVKNSPGKAGGIRDVGSVLGLERFRGGGHGSAFQRSCWRIPRTEKPGRLQPMGLQTAGHDRSNLARSILINPSEQFVNIDSKRSIISILYVGKLSLREAE